MGNKNAMAAKKLAKGDHVEWNTSQGKTTGKIVAKVTGTKSIKGHIAKPTKDDPQYEVKTDETGKTAIHKPAALNQKD